MLTRPRWLLQMEGRLLLCAEPRSLPYSSFSLVAVCGTVSGAGSLHVGLCGERKDRLCVL